MELIHRPGDALTCLEVRETLSDLIDARGGEIPYPGGTRLAEPGMRSAVELHLAGCAGCREDLHAMEEIGLAFSEYAVGEPPAQVFADYGRIVRERIAREKAQNAPVRNVFARKKRNVWLTLSVSGMAAAIAFAASAKYFRDHRTTSVATNPVKHQAMSFIDSTALSMTSPVHIKVNHFKDNTADAQFVTDDLTYNPQEPSKLKQIQDQVDLYKYVILAERPEPGEQSLFGAYLKTTREVDRADDGLGVGGVVVYDVEKDSPAEQMGLRKNDRIITINGMAIDDGGPQEAIAFLTGIHHLGKGAPVTLHVLRANGSQWFYMKPPTVTLGEYKIGNVSVDALKN
jgi:hypothetical protein